MLQAGVTISNFSILLLPNLKIRTKFHSTIGAGMKVSNHLMDSVQTQESNHMTIPVFSLEDTSTLWKALKFQKDIQVSHKDAKKEWKHK